MDAFWHFAKMMLRWRWYLAMGLAFAMVSAGGMATGVAAIQPVLDTVLEPNHSGLPDLAREYEWTTRFVPQSWIDHLPRGQFTAIAWIMGVLGVLTLFGAFAKFMHQFVSFTVVHKTIARIRREAFGRVIHLPLKTIVQDRPTRSRGSSTIPRRSALDLLCCCPKPSPRSSRAR